jgi:hypothetical protein
VSKGGAAVCQPRSNFHSNNASYESYFYLNQESPSTNVSTGGAAVCQPRSNFHSNNASLRRSLNGEAIGTLHNAVGANTLRISQNSWARRPDLSGFFHDFSIKTFCFQKGRCFKILPN